MEKTKTKEKPLVTPKIKEKTKPRRKRQLVPDTWPENAPGPNPKA